MKVKPALPLLVLAVDIALIGAAYLFCYVKDPTLRDQYHMLFDVLNRQAAAVSKLSKIPPPKQGWLIKQAGRVVKSWKRRFFNLSAGVLTYYDHSAEEGAGLAEVPRMTLKLATCDASVVVSDEHGSQVSPKELMFQVVSSEVKLLMKAETETEKKEWLSALRKHIDFAKDRLE